MDFIREGGVGPEQLCGNGKDMTGGRVENPCNGWPSCGELRKGGMGGSRITQAQTRGQGQKRRMTK